jgi:hypothetical protein
LDRIGSGWAPSWTKATHARIWQAEGEQTRQRIIISWYGCVMWQIQNLAFKNCSFFVLMSQSIDNSTYH